jgi:hypothetical protein
VDIEFISRLSSEVINWLSSRQASPASSGEEHEVVNVKVRVRRYVKTLIYLTSSWDCFVIQGSEDYLYFSRVGIKK